MSERSRDVSPEDAELQSIIEGLFGEYAARYGDYFSKDAEVELTEWYLAPQGLFIVLERDGEIIATGAYKPFDEHTAEIKRIWTNKTLRQQGLTPARCLAFADHHAFTAADLPVDADAVVITSKDAVKWQALDNGKLWVLPVTAQLDAGLVSWLVSTLKELRHGQQAA